MCYILLHKNTVIFNRTEEIAKKKEPKTLSNYDRLDRVLDEQEHIF